MHSEHRVIRLGHTSVDVHYSCLIDKLSPDQLVPHLVQRRLLKPETAAKIGEIESHIKKVSLIVKSRGDCHVAGMLPTFCAALISAGNQRVADVLMSSE